jgi:APA family basic amino acid/polyamine antiporter
VQTVTVVCKVAPLLLLSVALLPYASLDNLQPFAPQGLGSLLPAVSLVSWLFIGMESVTVPAEEIRGAGKTIRRAAYTGFAVTCAVYLLVLLTLNLAVPASELAGAEGPLAAVARAKFGEVGAVIVTVGALVSIAGILNGWLLVTSRMAFATARDGLAPRRLARLQPRTATPVAALVVSSALTGGLVLLYFGGGCSRSTTRSRCSRRRRRWWRSGWPARRRSCWCAASPSASRRGSEDAGRSRRGSGWGSWR